jgi:hypothetical protein
MKHLAQQKTTRCTSLPKRELLFGNKPKSTEIFSVLFWLVKLECGVFALHPPVVLTHFFKSGRPRGVSAKNRHFSFCKAFSFWGYTFKKKKRYRSFRIYS